MAKLNSRSARPTAPDVRQGPAPKKTSGRSGKKSKTVPEPAVEKISTPVQNSVDAASPTPTEFDSTLEPTTVEETAVEETTVPDSPAVQEPAQSAPQAGDTTMILKFVKINKNVAFYQGEGLKGSVRFLTSQFADAPPAQLAVSDGSFAVAEAKVKETKEERKARLAALTPEQKQEAARVRLAADEKRLAKRKAALGIA